MKASVFGKLTPSKENAVTRWNIQTMASKLPDECELRAHENRNIQFQMINGQLVNNSKSSSSGLSARSYSRGAWGFSSIPEISSAAVDRVVSQAVNNAKVLSRRVEHFDKNLVSSSAKGEKNY